MPQNHFHLYHSLPILKNILPLAPSVTPAARSAGEPNVQHDEPDQPDEPQTHTSCCHRQTPGEELYILTTSFFTSLSSLFRRARSLCWSRAWPLPLMTTSQLLTARRTSSSSTSPWTSATPPPHPCRRCKRFSFSLNIFVAFKNIFYILKY